MSQTDEEIRELCSRLLATDGTEFDSVLVELQSALRGRFERLSNLAVATILKMPRPQTSPPSAKEANTAKQKKKWGT